MEFFFDVYIAPIHFGSRNIEILKFLHEKGGNINLLDIHKKTPLFYAVDAKSLESIQYLLENKVSVKVSCTDGRTPLHEAAERGCVEIADELIKAGADVSQPNWSVFEFCVHKVTPLHLAASYGRLDVVELLVDNGAELDFQDSKGYTPLHYASQNNRSEIVEYLINNRANHLILNQDGLKAFEIAPEPLRSELTEYVINNLMTKSRSFGTSKTMSRSLKSTTKSIRSENGDNNENADGEANPDEVMENDEEEAVYEEEPPLLTPGKCVFCQAAVPVLGFRPCPHVQLCDNCYINHKEIMKECPICHKNLKRVEFLNPPPEPEPITEEPEPEEEETKPEPPPAEEEEKGETEEEEREEVASTEGESYATESTYESTYESTG